MTLTNDTATLTPRIVIDGPALAFDFPGVQVGIAEYDEGPTGCTVIHFGRRAFSATDVRGGSPGVYMPDAGNCHAICFAGGSLLGLEACTGVAAEIFAMGGYAPGWENIPCVQGAIIFDMAGPNSVYPDKERGRAALRATQPARVLLGPRGAGRGASVGKGFDFSTAEAAGQGAAFGQWDETKILVLTVVNAIGAIVDRQGNVVRGHLDRATGERNRIEEDLTRRLAAKDQPVPEPPSGNTTLTAVVTNQRLGGRDVQQVARQVHASMARCIQPFHTVNDGDVLFAVSTFEVQNEALPAMAIGTLASELAWDAVLSSFAQ